MRLQDPSGTKQLVYRRRWSAVPGIFLIFLLALGSLDGCTTPNAHSSGSNATASSQATSSSAGKDQNDSNPQGGPTVGGSVITPSSGSATGPSRCRSGDPLANVYHPNRLKVVKPCVTVSGMVESVRSEDDGDVHFDVALDPAYKQLLTSTNFADQHGWLVVEIVPADEPGCTPGQPPRPAHGTYNYGICTGADESPPSVGSHVFVTGPYVLDEDHGGWAEVHPAWAIASSPTSSTTTTTSPPPPTSGASCSASAAPSNDGYPGDYEVYVNSNQPDTRATASDANDTWSDDTNGSGYADIRLYNTSPGEPITVTVGGAICSTVA